MSAPNNWDKENIIDYYLKKVNWMCESVGANWVPQGTSETTVIFTEDELQLSEGCEGDGVVEASGSLKWLRPLAPSWVYIWVLSQLVLLFNTSSQLPTHLHIISHHFLVSSVFSFQIFDLDISLGSLCVEKLSEKSC